MSDPFQFEGRVAVITGAASGFGRAFAQQAAALGMKLVLADVDADALEGAVAAMREQGAQAIGVRTDVRDPAQVDALAKATLDAWGKVHLLFNNAGVGTGGFAWESSAKDWDWVFGVNVMGVANGVRSFTPAMLAQGERAHIVNTASVAGLLSPTAMAVYNASKHAVVSLTETLYHDLKNVSDKVGCSLLCPAFVPTGIANAERSRPDDLRNDAPPTRSQQAADLQLQRAVRSGRLTPDDVAKATFDAVRDGRFYILTHPGILASVKLRHEDIETQRNPTDPLSLKPEVKEARAQ
ncbi:NAD(P)-dependent dehydrogenase (short-subunit alcohol dehydrogenase family) [Paraburkholderia bannensis]|uniref:NAD(P)-dependent dehydrogenase (Short-subunit alcohol dehydrogenase family) n=1 Tax=Paraburkholderia bannensis TaxID=765414 RepID=A0A7W9TWV1_9BURK|nr:MULTISPECIES: SDR family oxidoreductase [Paraburkholderia]MBB3256711.1 NAD(P)-dependent dehydrogenase (short-subunit alcohol dehydrogenase family) [Paraburkholderia sp. WP4_3_2]MBB6101710.1 NAD(P)-dependent dehydrogenase (short-subunit alcohol dehydrogenase family) [Paraburkholderia bannensis]